MTKSLVQPGGPDLAEGIPLGAVPLDGVLAGHVGADKVIVSRLGDEFHAVGATCTHYGGPLAEGLVDGETIRCPWHHACFSLRTGIATKAPAFDPLDRWMVEVEGDRLFVRTRLKPEESRRASPPSH